MAKRIACILGNDFEDSELRVPYDKLLEAGHEVVIVGQEKGKTLKGKRGAESVKVELSISDAKPQDFDMLLIPGGYSPDNLRADERFVRFVKDFDDRGKSIAAVCHGPQLLLSAGLVEGRTLTAWKTVQRDLQLAGANVKDEPVVHDANWITSRQPSDLGQFSDAILQDLRVQETGAQPTVGP